MSKLRSVIRHEYMTIIRQPSFWISMVAFPIIFGAIFGLNYFSNTSGTARIEEVAKNLENVAIVDESELISEDVVTGAGLELYPSSEKERLQQSVQDGDVEALVVYPENITKDRAYLVYLASPDFSTSSGVGSLADTILETSLYLPLGDQDVIALAQQGASSEQVIYDNGRETAGIYEYIVPGFFLVLFYIVFLFSIGYMLTSVSDEKENRSMEMVLTYVKSRDLIMGKLLAVTLVTFTQLAFFAVLGLIALLVARSLGNELNLPLDIQVSELVFDPLTIAFALGFLVVGFLLFAGLMTTVAAISPSSKEANNFSVVFYLAPWIPFWFIMPILTDPENPVVRFLTYFPLTSPVVALVRNTIGNMSTLETAFALVVMTIFMVLSIAIAVRAFSRGALEFSQTIKLSSILKK